MRRHMKEPKVITLLKKIWPDLSSIVVTILLVAYVGIEVKFGWYCLPDAGGQGPCVTVSELSPAQFVIYTILEICVLAVMIYLGPYLLYKKFKN